MAENAVQIATMDTAQQGFIVSMRIAVMPAVALIQVGIRAEISTAPTTVLVIAPAIALYFVPLQVMGVHRYRQRVRLSPPIALIKLFLIWDSVVLQ